MAGPKKSGKEPAFEEALARLEEIVRGLEGGDLPLEDALRLFEEGVGLTRLCSAKLDEAQRKIEILSRSADGELRLAPFDPQDDGTDETDEER